MPHTPEPATGTGTPSSRPSFLVLLTDDQGPWATGTSWPELVTPVLDELAGRSTVFENYYCASPVCSPARASLLTGYMPSAHGVHDWLVGGRHPQATEEPFVEDVPTLPKTLHDAGYTTAMSGKWHVGTSQHPAPGFDYWYAHRYGGGPYYDAPIWDAEGREASEPRYFTDAAAQEACAMIDAIARDHPRSPFFLQVSFTAPHSPWVGHHPDDLMDIYADTDFPSVPRSEPHPWTRAYNDFAAAFADPVPRLRGYAASLSGVDRAVGTLLERLRAHGLDRETVVVYMSDNGFSCGQHGLWGKGNGTYPLNFWENSVRVPAWFALPGQSQGRTVARPVSACSFYETVCELAGVEVGSDPLRAAGSVAGLLRGQGQDQDEHVVVFDEYGGGRMIRSGRYKLIDRHEGPSELYDLDADPQEEENLVGVPSRAGLVASLRGELEEFFAAHSTPTEDAWGRDIRGRGQIRPPRAGLDDGGTYVLQDETMDGVGKS